MTLRDARPHDAPALAAVLQNWLDSTPWMPNLHDLAETTGFLQRLIATQRVRVAGQAEGFLALDPPWVTALYVARPGCGMGSALIAEAQAQQPALSLWCFQANAPARAFYAKQGFTEGRMTQGDNAEGLPDVCLHWPHRSPPS